MRRTREIALAVAGLAALGVGAFFVSPRGLGESGEPPTQAFAGSTYDAGAHGAKGLYLLLQSLGHRVARRGRAATAVPDERVRIVLGRGLLDAPTLAWVARGNTVVLAPPPPGTSPGERRHGEGRIVLLPRAEALENAALRRDPAPAVKVAQVCAASAYGGVVVFDESPRGGSLVATVARYPVGLMLLQGFVGLLLLGWARGARFGPVVSAAPPSAPPATTEQVAAVADLYEQAQAAPLAAKALAGHLRQRATRALGLPPTVDDDELAVRFCRRYGGAPGELSDLLTASRGRVTPRDLSRLARGLYDHEERIHGTRS